MTSSLFIRRRSGLGRRFGWLAVAGLTTAALAGPGSGAALGVTNWATVSGYAAGGPDNNHPEAWGDDCWKINSVDGSLGSTYVLTQNWTKVIVKAGSDQSALHPNTIFNSPLSGQTVWADSNGTGAFDNGDKGISHIIFCGPVETTTSTSSTETTSTETQSTETTSTETVSTETTSSDTTSTETTSVETESTQTTSNETTSTETTTSDTTSTQTTTNETSQTTSAEPTPTPTPRATPDPTPTPNPTPNPTPTPVPTPTPTPDPADELISVPTGEVLSEVGIPRVTLPPTDTLPQGTSAPSSDNWRLILLAMAGILAGSLVLTPSQALARRKER